MPGSKTHDILTVATLPPVMIGGYYIISAALDPTYLFLLIYLAIAHIFSGYMLSPDLDLSSTPYKRWGYFRFIWWPYKELVPHRGAISHTPILGSLIRLIYFMAPVVLITGFSGGWGFLLIVLEDYHIHVITVYCGLESAALVHIIADWIT